MKLWGNFLKKYSGWKIPKFEEKHWLLDPRSSPNPSQEKHKESHIRHVWVKEQKNKGNKKILRAATAKWNITYKGRIIQMKAYFSTERMMARRK